MGRRVIRGIERTVRRVGNMVGIGESDAEKEAKRIAEENKRIAEQQIADQRKRDEEKKRLDQFNKDMTQQQEQIQQQQTGPIEKVPQYDFSSVLLSKTEDEEDKLKKILTVKK